MRYSRTGEGMHRFTDPTDGETYLYTQLFMEDVQRVFAAFDQPDLKSVFELTVTAPDGWTVLGNGVTEHLGDGRWTAAPTPLISTYLVAVAAGPWHSVRTEHAGLPFGLHCRRSLAPHLDADADEILDITRACFDRYHEKFDEPYPFDSYDQAFVPEFNAGAMENPGLVTFRDEFIYRSAVTDTERQTRAMVIAHEMAHMWFGDLVTLRWWDDIWLNESFAEYMGYQTLTEATRFTDTWVDFAVARKAWGYDADQRPSTHPVAPDPDAVPDTASAMLNFDGISYAKGASALRQLVAWLGEKDFLAGINTHFARHRFGNATLADFIDYLASATDRDVHAWAESWLRTTGVDTLTPTRPRRRRQLAAHRRPHRQPPAPHRRRRLRHRAPADDRPPRPARPLRTRRPPRRLGAHPPRTAPRPPPPQRLRPHLRQGPLRHHVLPPPSRPPSPASPTPSAGPSSGTPRATPSATANCPPPPTSTPPAPTSRTRPTSPSSKASSSFASTHVADRYLTPEQRPAALATLTDLCRDLIRRTEDGSHPGLRLIAVRHCIDAAAHPDTISAWLSEGTVPGGPELDPELRWRILGRLCRPRRRRRRRHRRRTRPGPQRHRPGRRRPLPRRPARPRGQARRLARHVHHRRPLQLPLHRHRPGLLAARTERPRPRVRRRATSPTPSPSPPAAAPPSPTPPAAGPSPPTPSPPTPSPSARLPARRRPHPRPAPQTHRPARRPRPRPARPPRLTLRATVTGP